MGGLNRNDCATAFVLSFALKALKFQEINSTKSGIPPSQPTSDWFTSHPVHEHSVILWNEVSHEVG